jgi:YgiT-type zinc finger domain-containing protein
MNKGFAPLHIDRKGCHLTLDNVPAWVCSQCGEVYFEEAEVNIVQELITVIDQKAQPLAVNA